MNTRIVRADAQPALGWAGRVMQWLNAVLTLVLVNLLFVVGVLAGLVVLGIMPAATAAASVLLRDADGIESAGGTSRLFLRTYRAEFRRANLTGIPFLVAGTLLAADAVVLPHLQGPVAAALSALTLVATAVVLLAALVAVTLLVRYDDGPRAVLRFAVTVPLAYPLTAAGVLLVLISFGVIAGILPVLLPLVGASLPLAVAVRLIDRRLTR
ncbi:DUF624 domain-containing protein [Microbacterium sp.]|uniref:DUF624 domain-containing protein n=1 Tax=Microbacterium sp. TaxID=51671 RepID=UPI003C7085C3